MEISVKKKKIVISLLISSIIFIIFYKSTAAAISAPYPTLILIVENAPKDVSISLTEGEYLEWECKYVLWAKYYTLHLKDYNMDTIINVSGNENNFNVTIDKSLLQTPLNYATLDFNTQTIFPEKTLKHKISCIVPVIFFSLLLEGTIFYLLGYRGKKSWLAFILITVISRVIMNVMLYSSLPSISIMVFTRILLEIYISPFKALASVLLIREHDIGKLIGYALTADISNWFLGIFLLNVLPI